MVCKKDRVGTWAFVVLYGQCNIYGHHLIIIIVNTISLCQGMKSYFNINLYAKSY